MGIDKFGRSSSNVHHQRLYSKLQQVQFPRTTGGDYDIGNHRLCNLPNPFFPSDAANKQYVDQVQQSTYRLVLVLRAKKNPTQLSEYYYFHQKRTGFPIRFTGEIEHVEMYPPKVEMHHGTKRMPKDKLVGYKLTKGDHIYFTTESPSTVEDLYVVMTVKCQTEL